MRTSRKDLWRFSYLLLPFYMRMNKRTQVAQDQLISEYGYEEADLDKLSDRSILQLYQSNMEYHGETQYELQAPHQDALYNVEKRKPSTDMLDPAYYLEQDQKMRPAASQLREVSDMLSKSK